MRLLVACPQCKRQYDATQLGVGTRFHCRCGQVLTVQSPQAHAAAVTCCSHCGAPRPEGALSCAYCGAEFTLHDRDLDTVCPHCFARVSNQARFCEFCGTAIHPEMSAGETSQLICPACGEGHTLTSRAYGNVSALECQRCAGLWLSNEAFKQLTDQAAKEGVQNDPRWTPALARAPQVDVPLPHDGVHYRPCVMCHQLMLKQNYSHSGVLVDVCGKHGVWLDADALPRIIDWIHAGGLVWMNNQAAQRQAAEQARQQSQAKAEAELIESNIQPARPSRNFDLGGSVVARIIRWVLGIFS